ncbi:hypothetical protein HNR26_000158 [Rhizobium rosettiformans]|uniref:Uncharacterized protein n=2 Tax=Rhizobium rosettiformans TaxID=1368430 RepID=A0A4S8Q662_9HYPH|nr:hypothetical protein [Rhizobium rosettiformans]MBB5274120.1 hypothetical protein [Rhizobium rosettiformans]THV38222.1 hypothetical protein FAA86_05375 [Rhizobium rosettiformans W3]
MISSRVRLFRLTSALTLMLASTAPTLPALALSDIKDITPPAADTSSDEAEPLASDEEDVIEDSIPVIPDPDPLIKRNEPEAVESVEPPEPAAEVIYDIEKAPEPVRRMRQLIIDAATTGDISKLRPLMNPGPDQTVVPLQTPDQDPIEALKAISGDSDGIEVLAILLDIFSTGFVQLDKGTADEAYVWPYFAGKSLALLTPQEKVELLRIVTAGDVAEMQEYGNYNFFRVGITPDGRWKFLSVGD